jgi:hypothetical protein
MDIVENAQTLNAGPDSAGQMVPSTIDPLLSSPDNREVGGENGHEPSEETLNTDDLTAGTEDQGDKESQVSKSETGEEVPWHKDPRWQKFQADKSEIESEKTRIAQEKTQIEAEKLRIQELKKERGVGQTDTGGPMVGFKDITRMSDEELKEWQDEDPKGYAANLYGQLEHELTIKFKRDKEANDKQNRVNKTFESYRDNNPDFLDMINSGKIREFINNNPGHNPISAHMALTEEKRISGAVSKAVKENEKKMLANFQAKRESRVLGTGPSISGGTATEDKELSNTKEHGGKEAVQASRLLRLRRKAAAG